MVGCWLGAPQLATSLVGNGRQLVFDPGENKQTQKWKTEMACVPCGFPIEGPDRQSFGVQNQFGGDFRTGNFEFWTYYLAGGLAANQKMLKLNFMGTWIQLGVRVASVLTNIKMEEK